jgi:hypothetical protein
VVQHRISSGLVCKSTSSHTVMSCLSPRLRDCRP